MVYSGPENLSYSATRGSRLASLVFLVCKCLIIQGGSMIGLRWQSNAFHIFQLGLLGSLSLFSHHDRNDKDIVRFLGRTGYRRVL